MHVTAVNPRVARPEDMPEEELVREKEIIMAQPDMEGKPQEIKEKMAGGRIKKFLAENSLVEQPFVKDPEVKVGELAKKAGAEIVSFVRYEVGEGIEKAEVDFAAEVAAQVAATKK
jgi:elongation factor Ts